MPAENSDSAADTAATTPVQPDAAPATITLSDAKPDAAQSSSADEKVVAKEPESLLDAIKAVVEPGADAATAAAQAKADIESAANAAAENPDKKDTDGVVSDADLEKEVPFHNHPRWKQVLSERAALKAEREALAPRAQEYDLITQFMQSNGLSVEEVARGYEIMATMKNDPVRAYEMLSGHVKALAPFTGDQLPPDLEQRAADGMIDMATAKELAQRRAQDAFVAARNAQQQQINSQRHLAASQQAMASSVTAWETDLRTRDADYAKKQPLVLDRVRRLITENAPQTPEAALSLAQRAYKEVTESLRGFIPQPRAVTTQTSNGQGSATARPVAKTPLDAARNALASAA